MEDWLIFFTRKAVVIVDGFALLVILFGTVEAFVSSVWLVFRPSASGYKSRTVWIRYGRWLVAGLTFQLSADIMQTSITPSWRDIGQLAAIAVVRTFLNFFLERDLQEIRGRTPRTDSSGS